MPGAVLSTLGQNLILSTILTPFAEEEMGCEEQSGSLSVAEPAHASAGNETWLLLTPEATLLTTM